MEIGKDKALSQDNKSNRIEGQMLTIVVDL